MFRAVNECISHCSVGQAMREACMCAIASRGSRLFLKVVNEQEECNLSRSPLQTQGGGRPSQELAKTTCIATPPAHDPYQ